MAFGSPKLTAASAAASVTFSPKNQQAASTALTGPKSGSPIARRSSVRPRCTPLVLIHERVPETKPDSTELSGEETLIMAKRAPSSLARQCRHTHPRLPLASNSWPKGSKSLVGSRFCEVEQPYCNQKSRAERATPISHVHMSRRQIASSCVTYVSREQQQQRQLRVKHYPTINPSTLRPPFTLSILEATKETNDAHKRTGMFGSQCNFLSPVQ